MVRFVLLVDCTQGWATPSESLSRFRHHLRNLPGGKSVRSSNITRILTLPPVLGGLGVSPGLSEVNTDAGEGRTFLAGALEGGEEVPQIGVCRAVPCLRICVAVMGDHRRWVRSQTTRQRHCCR